MQLLIAAVGRLKDDAERVLVDRYAGRIGNGRVSGLGPLREIEITESRRTSAAERKAEEATRLLAAVRDADTIVMLDETGRALASEPFARQEPGDRSADEPGLRRPVPQPRVGGCCEQDFRRTWKPSA